MDDLMHNHLTDADDVSSRETQRHILFPILLVKLHR